MARIIAVSNIKGGVAKTTSTINLAAVLAIEYGLRILACDIDPQANLTMSLGVEPYDLQQTIYQVLLKPNLDARRAIVSTQYAGLDLLPANLDLAGADMELKAARDTRLQRALIPIQAEYDFILIDTPPSLGLFTQNALMACSEIIVPVEPSYYALRAMYQLQAMLTELIEPFNTDVGILGILLTRYDARTNLTAEVERQIRKEHGDLVFRTVIPANVKAAEAPATGEPVICYARQSASAAAYRALASEVIARGQR